MTVDILALLSASGRTDPSKTSSRSTSRRRRRLPADDPRRPRRVAEQGPVGCAGSLAHLGDRAVLSCPQGPVHRQPQRQATGGPVGGGVCLATSRIGREGPGVRRYIPVLEDNLTFDGIVLQVHSVRALSKMARAYPTRLLGSSTPACGDGLLPRSEARAPRRGDAYFADDSAFARRHARFCEGYAHYELPSVASKARRALRELGSSGAGVDALPVYRREASTRRLRSPACPGACSSRELLQMRHAIFPVSVRSSSVTLVSGSRAPCSSSTSSPRRNCSRSMLPSRA